MKTFYTNVLVWGSKVLYRGVENGTRIRRKVDYRPSLFVPSPDPTKFTTIHGEYVSKLEPGSIKDCREFVKKYADVANFPIYGNQRYEYAFIADQHEEHVDWDRDYINICNLDLEVGSANGFPEPATAVEPITAITYKRDRDFVVLGCGPFDNHRDDVRYVKCDDEIHLLATFLSDWTRNYPDVLTGWNITRFDIPYLVNRIVRLMGEDVASRLSPWGNIRDREARWPVGQAKRVFPSYSISGIANLDYLDMYIKFSPEGKSQESYKLDHICSVEIGEKKLSYEEYGSLHRLYVDNHQKFIEYNIRDVELIDKLDDKLKLLDLAFTLAYDSRTNYDDVFSQVRMWDAIIYNHLRSKKMVMPPMPSNTKDSAYKGAYVKEPLHGAHDWVASFDVASLYPSTIVQGNLSPETVIKAEDYTPALRTLAAQKFEIDILLQKGIDLSAAKSENVTVMPNGAFFRRDKEGFMSEITREMFDDRQRYKKKMLEAEAALQKATSEDEKTRLHKEVARYNNLQLVKKVCLNSLYGACGTPYFRFYDLRIATAITYFGELAIRWIGNRLNDHLNGTLGTSGIDYVIASDTDSVFLRLKELVDKVSPESTTESTIKFLDAACTKRIQNILNIAFDELADYLNSRVNRMSMKREALADRGIWIKKKRYVLRIHNNEGVSYTKPKIKVKGLEIVKSSTPTVCRKKLREAVDIMLDGTQDDMLAFIVNFRKEFRTLSIPDIGEPRGVSTLDTYDVLESGYQKGTPKHAKSVIAFNRHLEKLGLTKQYAKISEGDKIKMMALKEPNPFKTGAIGFINTIPPEFKIEEYFDYEKQFEATFLKPLRNMISKIGWSTEKRTSMLKFFE